MRGTSYSFQLSADIHTMDEVTREDILYQLAQCSIYMKIKYLKLLVRVAKCMKMSRYKLKQPECFFCGSRKLEEICFILAKFFHNLFLQFL